MTNYTLLTAETVAEHSVTSLARTDLIEASRLVDGTEGSDGNVTLVLVVLKQSLLCGGTSFWQRRAR